MPQLVEKLTAAEERKKLEIRSRFTEEQMCAYFLTKTIRSLYQFNDEFVAGWYEEIYGNSPETIEEVRPQLVKAYTEMLMIENKYIFHLDYWLRIYQEKLMAEMVAFFSSDAGY